MMTGSRTFEKPVHEVRDRLKMILAAANCSVSQESGENVIHFQHGTYLTQSATLIPKSCTIRLESLPNGTRASYEVGVSVFLRAWMIFVAVLTCWAVFPPILNYRALVVHPRRFMENLLDGV